MIKDIVIAGGGFAGYMTALCVHDTYSKYYSGKEFNLTVIESSKLGTIGVGESTAQNIPRLLALLGIDVYQFMKESNATFKLSARFDNWNYEGEKYHHPLVPLGRLVDFNLKTNRLHKPVVFDPYLEIGIDIVYFQAKGIDWAKLCLDNLIEDNKVPFRKTKEAGRPYQVIGTSDLIDQNTRAGADANIDLIEQTMGFHMDANLSVKYLQKMCKARGIKIIDGKIADWKLDSDTGHLKEVTTDQGDKIPGDFFFDCTGFRRLIIGEIFKEKWIDWSHQIPQNSVSLIDGGVKYKEGEHPPVYTKLDAQKHGWMFKIPLTSRIGSGYVYSDKFVDKETIHKEQIEHWNAQGYDVEIGNQLSWSAGKYERSLVKNCLAVGLSDGFVEPLDGNALILSMQLLQNFLPMFDRNMLFDSIDYKDYNERALDAYEHTKNYIYFAHLQRRKDSEYWKFFKDDKNIPQWLKEKIWLWAHRPPRGFEELSLNHRPFGIGSFCTIGQKSGLSGVHVSKRDMEDFDFDNEGDQIYKGIQDLKKRIYDISVDHKDMLEWIQFSKN